MVNWIPIVLAGTFGIIGLYYLLSGIGRLRAWNELRGSSAGAVTGPGAVEVEGIAQPHEETLDPPHAATDSLAYKYEREESRPDPDPDEHGDEWHTTKKERDSVPFVVNTGDQEVLVDPGDADLMFEKEVDGNHQRRHTSWRLDDGEDVYVAGEAVPAADADVPPDGQRYTITGSSSMLGQKLSGLTGTPFIIADTGEDAAEGRMTKLGILRVVIGVGLLGITTALILFGLGG